MGSYAIYSQVKLTAVFKDTGGTAKDPDTVICKYKNPNGTTTTLTYGTDAALVKDSTGNYHVNITVDVYGEWIYRWEASGNTAGIIVAAESYFLCQKSSFY